MTFEEYLKANYTQQEIALMSREGLAYRKAEFDRMMERKS